MENNKKETTKGPELSDEFKTEIKKKGKKNNLPRFLLITTSLIIVFGVIGLGGYEIFFQEKEIEQQTSEEKILNTPTEETAVEEKTDGQETTPAAEPADAKTTTPSSTEYVVVAGDTLGAIATKYNITVEALKTLNNITDETLLQIGQKLKIPN